MKTKDKSRFPLVQDKRTYTLTVVHMTTPVGASVTVPDDTLTIKQIMDKHVHGMNVISQMAKTPIYSGGDHDSEDMEALMRMDLADRSQMADDLSQINNPARQVFEKAVAADKKSKEQSAKKAREQADQSDKQAGKQKNEAKRKHDDDAD